MSNSGIILNLIFQNSARPDTFRTLEFDLADLAPGVPTNQPRCRRTALHVPPVTTIPPTRRVLR